MEASYQKMRVFLFSDIAESIILIKFTFAGVKYILTDILSSMNNTENQTVYLQLFPRELQ